MTRPLAVLAATTIALLAGGARAEDPAGDMDPQRAAQVEAETRAEAAEAQKAGLPLPEATKAQAAAAAASIAKRRSDRWGLVVDLGVPEGAAVGVLFRPLPVVRLWAGPAWNYVGWGVQAGVAAVPWHFAVTPVLSAEVGHYFDADVSVLASNAKGVPEELKPLLQRMGYSYAAVHVGIELGSQRGLSLFLRAGISYLSLSSSGSYTTTDASGVTVTFTDPRVHGTIPSVKTGIQYWF